MTLAELVAVFLRSDLSGVPDPAWYVFLAATGSHVLIGLALSLIRVRLAVVVFCAWAVKEAAFDMPHASWAAVVVIDSLADLAAGLAGFVIGRTRRGRMSR